MMNSDNRSELFPVVDPDGRVVGSATRGECHGGSMLLHPVVHLHLFNSRGELYLQRRPLWKDIQPGRWDTAVGGHVSLGETIDEALRLYNRNNTVFEYRANGYSCKIPYRDIHYFYSENKKINMVTAESVTQFTGKIKDLAGVLPGNFIQIHQSFIINMNHMSECSYELVRMSGGAQLNISQPYRKQVRKQIMDYAWGQDS